MIRAAIEELAALCALSLVISTVLLWAAIIETAVGP